ncbi:GNAT family N-acetyltransferase [Cohnella sp. REN36]|uniref:GNAT family N-acetyltransferase n=1 Tax=Cohnella sp. REN36 TaxID=2887347 RepID=UPI001D14405A|nr:GNAT family N-acetyltransferase [Cohnella sp. REN36]MCC3376755.1 GNAT family N-acetyltransferase [Cohnella sp. REN36]
MDFEPLEQRHLDGILALWNKELADQFPMRAKVLRQNILEDRNWLREGSWVATDRRTGKVAGFVVAKIARAGAARFGIGTDTGWIHALLVDANARGQGVGAALLGRAEAALRHAGATNIALGNDLHRRMFPGIPEELEHTRDWFDRRGYVFRERAFDLLRAYRDDEPIGFPVISDVSFRLATPDDRESLTAFMERCFPGTWAYQHADYWEQGGTGREYVVLEKQGAIIGFCRINDDRSPLQAQNVYWAPLFEERLGGIGPLGIDEAERGHQYGISIVKAAIAALYERGVRRMVIDTTPFVEFYGKLGYVPWKSYAKYDKWGE